VLTLRSNSRYHRAGTPDPKSVRALATEPSRCCCRNGDQLNGLDGPHREMAIDVPSNFVPQKKEKPRLSGSWGKEAEKAEKLKKYQKAVKDKNETNLK